MKAPRFLFWIGLLLLATACSEDSTPVFKQRNTKYRVGDKPEYAAKALDERKWHRRPKFVPDGKIFWYRTKVDILEAPKTLKPYGLRIEVYGEYEIYWDGELIGKNGNPGQEASLPPQGELWTTFSLPTHLTHVGEHILALRISNYYYPDHIGIYALKIDDYNDLVTDRLIQNSYMHRKSVNNSSNFKV